MVTARQLVLGPVVAALLVGCVADFSDRPFVDSGVADAALGCGNGQLEPGEACDGTDLGGLTCRLAVNAEFGELRCTGGCQLDLSGCHNCGNGLIDVGEGCDVRDASDNDGCSDVCQPEHGFDCTGEPSVCVATCGDGVVAAVEACDDGDLGPGDGCDASCAVEPGWACSGEPSVCAESCGNSVVDLPAEGCDDGGLAPGDGCSPACQVETGWTCAGSPSTCTPVCGDGLVLSGEGCDDGGLAPGDGCSPACVVEPFFQCAGAPSVCSCAVFVNVAPVAGARNGQSWATAYATVQAGIGTAGNLPGCDVWVAAGEYHIFQSSPANRVSLASNVSLLGGFAGTETHRDQRDPAGNVTVLDGEHETLVGQRVRTVVEAMGVTGTLIDGFTITHGAASNNGGGMNVNGGSVVVHRCRFLDNAADSGAGLYASNGTITVTESAFEANVATQDGGGAFLEQAQATLSGCRFQANESGNYAGGLYALGGGLVIQRSRFLQNVTSRLGGGLRLENMTPLLENLLLVGNVVLTDGSGVGGGAMSFYLTSPATVVGCTFHANQASLTGGLSIRTAQGTVNVGGSIFSPESTAHFYENLGGNITLMASDVWGEVLPDCINADPGFVDPVGGDFRLGAGSPCIDSGDSGGSPATDLDGNPRVDDPATIDACDGGAPCPDMGSFEFQP